MSCLDCFWLKTIGYNDSFELLVVCAKGRYQRACTVAYLEGSNCKRQICKDFDNVEDQATPEMVAELVSMMRQALKR